MSKSPPYRCPPRHLPPPAAAAGSPHRALEPFQTGTRLTERLNGTDRTRERAAALISVGSDGEEMVRGVGGDVGNQKTNLKIAAAAKSSKLRGNRALNGQRSA